MSGCILLLSVARQEGTEVQQLRLFLIPAVPEFERVSVGPALGTHACAPHVARLSARWIPDLWI